MKIPGQPVDDSLKKKLIESLDSFLKEYDMYEPTYLPRPCRLKGFENKSIFLKKDFWITKKFIFYLIMMTT